MGLPGAEGVEPAHPPQEVAGEEGDWGCTSVVLVAAMVGLVLETAVAAAAVAAAAKEGWLEGLAGGVPISQHGGS